MTCIIKGQSIACTQASRDHYMRGKKNEKITICEVSGFATQNADEALAMLELSAKGTKCKKPVYSTKINPETDRIWTEGEWKLAIDLLEKNLGLTGHPRVVVEHTKKGRIHRHVLWSRYHPDGGPAKNMGNDYAAHQKAQKELEQAFKLRPMMAKGRDFKHWEVEWAKRYGLDIFKLRDQITADFKTAKSGQAFKTQLEAKGIVLCRGDKSQFVLILPWGQHKALSSMIMGRPTKAILHRAFGDIDISKLPTVQEAKAQVKARLPKMVPKSKSAKGKGRSGKFGAVAHIYIRGDKGGGRVGGRGATAPKRRRSSSIRYWRIDGHRLTSSRAGSVYQPHTSTSATGINRSASGTIQSDLVKSVTSTSPNVAGSSPPAIVNDKSQTNKNILPPTTAAGTNSEQHISKPPQSSSGNQHYGSSGSHTSAPPPAPQPFRPYWNGDKEEKKEQQNTFMPSLPDEDGGMCLAQKLDLRAVRDGKMSYAEYCRKWGIKGPSM